jgi:hypothetical protein
MSIDKIEPGEQGDAPRTPQDKWDASVDKQNQANLEDLRGQAKAQRDERIPPSTGEGLAADATDDFIRRAG